MSDFNIHVDNEKDALGSAFIHILKSIRVRQHVSGPTHCRNHTLDLIMPHGIDVSGLEVLQQSVDISDHYLGLCNLHIAKDVNSNRRNHAGSVETPGYTGQAQYKPSHNFLRSS